MTRTETRRMLELERARDEVIGTESRAALRAWDDVHGAELDTLHAMETADMDAMRGSFPTLSILTGA